MVIETTEFTYFLTCLCYLPTFGKILTESERRRGKNMVLNYKRIGQRIRVIRRARKMTQAELAECANLSVPYVSHIENGIKQALSLIHI